MALDLELSNGGGVLGAGAGASTTDYPLTPTSFGPVAQWALQGATAAALLHDRSGNGRDLASVINGPVLAPDGSVSQSVTSTRMVSLADPALQITGDLTCTCRAWALLDATPPGQMLFSLNDGNDVNGLYFLGLDVNGHLITGIEVAGNIGIVYTSTLVPPFGTWNYYSLRRDAAAGTWTIGLNGVFDTSPPMQVVTTITGNPRLFVGGSDVDSVPWFWRGSQVDLSVWGSRLTDAQVLALAAAVGF